MKFALAAVALLATTTNAIFGCGGCDCGEMVCEATQSQCIFDHIAQGRDELNKDDCEKTLHFAIHKLMHVPYGDKLDEAVTHWTGVIMDGRSGIDAAEFKHVYDGFREHQLGCQANGEWGKDTDYHWNAHYHGEDWCIQYKGIPSQEWDTGIHKWAVDHAKKYDYMVQSSGPGQCNKKDYQQFSHDGKKEWDFRKYGVTLGITVWKK